MGRASSDASETSVGVSVREATTDADAGEIATDAAAGGIAADANAGEIEADVRSEENERMLNLLSKSPDDVSLRSLHQVKNLIRR